MSSSHMRTERALDALLQHFQTGNGRSKSRAAIAAVGEESMEVAWPLLLDALEDYGLDRETANENHLFIADWLVGAMMDGLLPVDGVNRNSTSSVSSVSDPDSFSPADVDADSDSEPDEYPGVLGKLPTRTHAPGFSALEDLQYLTPFGQLGRIIAKEVRPGRCTFKADINRAREYWRRGDWEEVKAYLIRVLVAAQQPNHRQSDLNARTATFLLGIAYSNSGDLETAMRVMLSVMTPFDRNDQVAGPCDAGHIAAATWLGDLCLKTNRIESAALAWSIAYDAINLKSTRMSEGHPAFTYPTTTDPSNADTPSPLQSRPQRPTSLSRAFRVSRVQAIAILNRLESVNRKIRNLDALCESLDSGWDPDNADYIFAQSRVLPMIQMQRVAQKARRAIETAVEAAPMHIRGGPRTSPRASTDHSHKDSKPLPSPPPPRAIVPMAGGRTASEEITTMLTPVEDVLQTPVRSSEWPLAYDIKFSRSTIVKTINWVYSFTPLDLEGVTSNIPSLDVRQYRAVQPHISKPMFVAEKLDTKKTEDGGKFVAALQRMLDTLGFEYLEEPGRLRCRPRTDRSSKWPSIACFALYVIKYKPDGFKKTPKFAAYVSDVVHWTGRTEDSSLDHMETKLLMQDMTAMLHSLEIEERDIWAATFRTATPRPQATQPPAPQGSVSRVTYAAHHSKKISLTGPKALKISQPISGQAIEAPW